MTKPIPDKAEVVLEYPDKFYCGTFERSSRFDAHVDATGISLLLDRPGDAEVLTPHRHAGARVHQAPAPGVHPQRPGARRHGGGRGEPR